MSLRLVQLSDGHGRRVVCAVGDDGVGRQLQGIETVYGLARTALDEGRPIAAVTSDRMSAESLDLAAAERENRLLAPIDHPDPAHLHLTGTGLTHLGSAEGRDKMHKAAAGGTMTDSMRMFLLGVEGGKPEEGKTGAQPEWFYKGNGNCLVGSGAALEAPDFSRDGGEEPEIAGIYIIDADGTPRRLGFALANEFSDHVTERDNYLWLAHSKLRPAAVGPELLLGDLPPDVRGVSRILRDGELVWEKPFLSGETNMSHTIANLEYHHFKYPLFRQPGDVHIHFFGTATLSFADGVRVEPGDMFEVSAEPFTLSLRNRLGQARTPDVRVSPL